MARAATLGVLALAGGGLVTGCGDDDDGGGGGGSTESVTIGEIGHLTGIGAGTFGEPVHNGLELAMKDVRESDFLPDVDLKLESKDDASEATQTVTAFNQYVRDGVPVVVNSAFTPNATAVAPLADKEQVLLISAGSAGTGDDKPDYFSRMSDGRGPELAFGRYLAEDRGVSRAVSVIDGDNAGYVPIMEAATEGLEEGGAEGVVASETVATDDTDFGSVLTNLSREDADAVMLATNAAPSGNILQQMAQAGQFRDAVKAGHVGWGPEVAEVAGRAATGALFPQPWAPGAPDSEQFEQAYESAYGGAPTAYSALGYDTGWLIAAAVKQIAEEGGEVTGESLKDALPDAASSEEFQSNNLIEGFSLDASGAPSYSGVVAEFTEDGAVTVVEAKP